MRGIVKLLVTAGLGAALSGCVVAPVGVPARAYVGVGVVAPAPVVVSTAGTTTGAGSAGRGRPAPPHKHRAEASDMRRYVLRSVAN